MSGCFRFSVRMPSELLSGCAGIRNKQLLTEDPTISGFNLGVNSGVSAGQTVFHTHIHLIPRRDGDTVNPAGGVRKLIGSVKFEG